MKKLQRLLILAYTLTSLNAHSTLIEGRPLIKHHNLMMSEEQLIQAIKNERHASSGNQLTMPGLFFQDDMEKLEEQLRQRLHEVGDMTYFRNKNSLDNALIFSALAFQAWNPELRHVDVKIQIVKNIINFGFMKGFVLPTMSLMDLSYSTGKPEFGNLMNVMLAEIAPRLANEFTMKYGIPNIVGGRNFLQISNQGRNEMWSTLVNELGSDFFPNHNENSQKNILSEKLMLADSTPMAPNEDGPRKAFTLDNEKMIIKVIPKVKDAEQIPVNSIYPSSPNLGD